jgi:hypothetical protein
MLPQSGLAECQSDKYRENLQKQPSPAPCPTNLTPQTTHHISQIL